MIDTTTQSEAIDPTKASEIAPELCVTVRRKKEHRTQETPVVLERRTGQKRRDDSGKRRRLIDPTTCERDYTDDEIGFVKAMDQYKRDNRRQFPTWSEVLEVLHALGYRKAAKPTPLPGLSTGLRAKVKG